MESLTPTESVESTCPIEGRGLPLLDHQFDCYKGCDEELMSLTETMGGWNYLLQFFQLSQLAQLRGEGCHSLIFNSIPTKAVIEEGMSLGNHGGWNHLLQFFQLSKFAQLMGRGLPFLDHQFDCYENCDEERMS